MKKTTKRALLMSALSLLLCVSMLVGSTFAWFTDSVTSAGNKIQSGTLKIDLELYDKDTKTWNSIKETKDPIFNYDKWEPGYTAVQLLKIENEGNLALKWYAKFVSESKLSKLADVIDVYVCPSATELTYPTSRELTGYTKVGTVAEFVNTIETTTYGNLTPAGETGSVAYLGIALKMQETADNDYQNLDLGGVFDIQILATQYTYEKDSFDDQYDKDAVAADAYVTNAAELAEAVAAGGNIALMADITVDDATALKVAKGSKTVINLNGNDLIGTSTKDSGNQYAIQVKGDLTIIGEGTVAMGHTGADMGWFALTAAISVEGGTLTLGEGVVVKHTGGSAMAYAVDVNSTLGETTLNVNGAVLSSSYIGVRLFNNNKTAKVTVNLNSGVVDGDKRDIWVQNPSAAAVDANGIVNIADSYNYTMTTQSASSFYGRIYDFNTTVAHEQADLKEAIKDGKNTVLTGDMEITGAVTTDPNGYNEVYGNKIGAAQYGGTLDGNGSTLSNPANDAYVLVTHGGKIQNLIIDSGARGIVTYSPTEDVYIDNVVIDGPGYALNSTEHSAVKLIVTDSVIRGWSSLAGFELVSFEGCTFGENSAKVWQGYGYGRDYDRLYRVYSPAVLTNCVFEEGFYLDLSALDATGTLTLNNCVCNGTVITAANYADYITIELPGGRTLAECVVFN